MNNTTKFLETAFVDGITAAWAKVPKDLNPYDFDSEHWYSWLDGWHKGCDERHYGKSIAELMDE